jgi:hypothetical protein
MLENISKVKHKRDSFIIMAEEEIETSCEIRCLKCGRWFRSGIQFGSADTFFTSTLVGNLQQCTKCGKMTGCNKENMRFVERRPDGGVTYVEGKDTF